MTRRKLRPRLSTLAAGLAVCGLIAGVAAQSGRADTTLFFDNMENGINGWTVSAEAVGGATCASEWHQDTIDPAVNPSETHYWTNSPYAAATTGNCLNHLTSPSIPLPATATGLTLKFWEHHFTEGGTICNPPENNPACDFGIVEVSNNGAAFKAVPDPDSPAHWEGGTSPVDPYVEVTLLIPAAYYTPGLPIRIRFTFSSDALLALPAGGWFIDDVSVTVAGTTSVGVRSFTGKASRNAVTLSWKTGSEVGVLGFNVWRYDGARSVKANRALILAKASGLGAGAAYRLVDRTARPGTRYTYRLQVVSSNGKRTWAGQTTLRAGR